MALRFRLAVVFGYTFQWRVVIRYWPELVKGALLTLEITIISVSAALFLAMFLAVFRKSENIYLRKFSAAWVAVARNTPGLLQIYIAYFGLGGIGIHLSPYWSVLSALIFHNVGYLTEILRGGIDSIDPSQKLSARGLGLTGYQTYKYVIFPQVIRIVYLPIINQMIFAMLLTSLGTIIGLQELTGMTTFLQSQTFRPFEFYLFAALLYFIICKIIMGLSTLGKLVFLKG